MKAVELAAELPAATKLVAVQQNSSRGLKSQVRWGVFFWLLNVSNVADLALAAFHI